MLTRPIFLRFQEDKASGSPRGYVWSPSIETNLPRRLPMFSPATDFGRSPAQWEPLRFHLLNLGAILKYVSSTR
jgi:hypothetical protein